MVVAIGDLDLTNAVRPRDPVYLREDADFDAPVRRKEQVVGNSGERRKFAGERIAEVRHILEKVELAEYITQCLDEGKIKQPHDPPMQPIRVPHVKPFGEL